MDKQEDFKPCPKCTEHYYRLFVGSLEQAAKRISERHDEITRGLLRRSDDMLPSQEEDDGA